DWTSLAIRARSWPRSSSITRTSDAELAAGARTDGDAELGRLGHGLALPADFELQLPLVLLLRDLDLELHVRPRCQPERALARFEADFSALETDRERSQVLRDLLRRRDTGEFELVLPHAGLLRTYSSSSSSSWARFHAMAISILAFPFFSLASMSMERSPSGKTSIRSSPSDNDSDRARIPSAIRFSASAASAGDATPSYSNSLRPIPVPPRGDPDQRPLGPAQLHRDVIRPLLLLDLDLEHQEFRRRQ